ncbi:MAG TPA: tetratricopeptide repeat protein, partial [Verrucomicrobiales bacterium]|nr:tetratricopeptide repeat protein [Verrucomicrobiales bacterium]
MKISVPFLPGAAAVLLASLAPLSAQDAPPEKVRKHYEMLLKRPAPGYLFDRFFNGWLDSATLEDLEKFLTARATAEGTTANHLLLAFFYARQGDSVKAIARFRIALEKDPGSADAWYQKAVVEARTLNFDTALSDLEKAVAAKPKEEMELTIRQFQARLLIRSGKPGKATEVFKALVAARPGNEDLREDIIELLVTEGLMDDAATASRDLIALTKDPQKKVLRRLRLGDILQRAGKREEAVDIYAATLTETGSDSWLEKEIISQIEQVYRREDDIAGLRERLQAMITAEPKRLALRLAQARMLTADGQTEASLKAWQEILALTPGNRALRETYIEQMAALKKLPEAIAQMKDLTVQHATDLELLPRLADLYFQNKNTDQCRATLLQFIEKSDKQEGLWLRTAALMERYGLSSDALELLTKASTTLPDSEAIAEARAVTLHSMDKKADAVAVWKKLATGKNRERTLQVARLATARGELQAAFDILFARLKDFENDPLYLAELVTSAVKVKREADALPWARRRIALTSNATDLEPALDDAVRIIATLDKEQDVIKETGPEATPQELSLAAALHESLGNPKQAEELLTRVTAVMPDLGGSLQVRLFITRGEPLKAAEAMKKVIELPDGRKTAAVQRLVELYQRAGRLEDALKWTLEWKRLSPGAVQPWDTEAQLLALSGRNAESLKALRQASQMFPDNEDLKAGLARRYREDGLLADAQRILEQLYEDGKDPGAKLRWVGELAQTAEQQGRTKELVEGFEERRRTNRGSTLPLLALSEIYRNSGSYEERRAALLEAARIKPDDLDLLMEIARIEQSQGELNMSLETLRKARPLDQSNRVIQKIAEILFALGKDDEAVAMMEEIDTAKRLDPAAVESLAISVIGRGEWERAETFLLPLLTKYPDNYRLRYLYAITLEELGRIEESRDVFLRLVASQKEMQGARAAKYREQYTTLQRHVPDAAVQIMDLMNNSGYPYLHRQRSGSSGYYTTVRGTTTYVSSGGTPQPPWLPSDLAELKILSLHHLATISQSLDDPSVAALKKDLVARGFPWAEYLTELYRRTGSSGGIPLQVANLVKAQPKEDYALALLCLNMTYSPAGRFAPELREAFTRFRDRYPQLAAMALLSLLRHDDAADLPLLKDGIDILSRIEQPIDNLSYSLSNVTWMASSENTSIKAERRELAKVVLDKLEAMYAALPVSSNARLQLQSSIFSACMNRRDWPRMVRMLETELADALSSSAQAAAYRNYYGGYDNQFISEPPFPPRRLPLVPAPIVRRWGLDNGGGDFYLNVEQSETEKFKTAVRAGKDPTIRIFLALRFNDEEFTNEMLKAAASSPEPGAAVCTILAGWHAGKNEPDKALEWLRRTQLMPLTRDDRAIIDCYLLGVITLGGLNPAPDTPDFTAARDAVVRLRQTRLDNAKREAMAAALNALGLNEDAEKLLAANTAASRQPSSSASRPSNAPPTVDVKIEQLFKQGQKEKAMTLLLRELRTASRGGGSRDSTALIKLANRLNLKDEVLRQMKPADNATTGLAEYGWLCTSFDDKDGGRLWTEKAVAARPRDLTQRLLAASAYINAEKPDVEAAWKLLEAAPAESFASMDSNFMRLFGSSGRLESQFASLELLRRFIEKHRETPGMEWGWTLSALDYAVRQGSGDNINLPAIYSKAPATPPSLTRATKLKELETRRRTLHDSICTLLFEIPGTRPQAFTRIASLRLAEEKDGDDLIGLAKKALVTKIDPNVVSSVSRYSYGYDDDGRPFQWQTPENYLAESALKKNDRALLESVAAELDKQERSDEAKRLRAQADLYFCPESEFAGKARAQLMADKPEDRLLQDTTIVQIWKKRKLPPVLNEMLLERANLPEARRNGAVNLPQDYLSELVTAGRRAEVESMLKSVCLSLLGPEDKRTELLRQYWNPRGYSPPGNPGYLIRSLRQYFMQYVQKDELAILSMEIVNDQLFRFYDEVRRDDYYGENMRIESSALRDWPPSQKPERAKVILNSSPFLGDLPDWHPVMNPSAKNTTVLPWLLKGYVRAGSTPAVRKSGTALLKEYPATFGREILLAAATADKEDAMRKAVLDLLVSRRADLEKLPPERLIEVAAFAVEMATSDPAKLKVSPEA